MLFATVRYGQYCLGGKEWIHFTLPLIAKFLVEHRCLRARACQSAYFFEHLEAGDSLEVFLQDFPSVSRDLAVRVLEDARIALAPDAHPA